MSYNRERLEVNPEQWLISPTYSRALCRRNERRPLLTRFTCANMNHVHIYHCTHEHELCRHFGAASSCASTLTCVWGCCASVKVTRPHLIVKTKELSVIVIALHQTFYCEILKDVNNKKAICLGMDNRYHRYSFHGTFTIVNKSAR